MTMPQLPRSQQEEVPAGPAPVAGLKRRAQSLPAVGRPQHAVTAFVSPSAPSSPPRRSSPQPAAATVVEAADIVEFVTVALNLAKPAHDGIQRAPAAVRTASGLSASATECGGDSPIPPQQPIPPCKTPKLPSAAPGTASRNVPYRALSRCWDHSLEQLHIAARLSAVRAARRRKLQSSID